MSNQSCESCSMPIESGHYCQHCTDAKGNLQPFEERFERMIAWQKKRTPNASRAELEPATLAFMAKMPAGVERSSACSRTSLRSERNRLVLKAI